MGNIVEELDADLIAYGPSRDDLMTALADIRDAVLGALGEDHPLYDRWLGDTMGSPLSVPGLVAEYVGRHGTRARYVKGCRCVPCRKANWEYERARRRRHGVLERPKGCGLPHGTPGRYKHGGCRCRRCTTAAVAYNRELRQRARGA